MASGTGLYWITGKAGSGKSTLMKFLYNDPRTSEHLRSWASPLPLVTAAFFFWNSGSEMQMSQSGLLRTLLCRALQQCRSLIPRVFPERWEAYSCIGDDTNPWAWSELVRALELLVREDGVTIKLCLFIDGLDEFDGSHERLIDLIQNLVSSSAAKICVSSRPWLVFEEAFRLVPHLMLQDLTKPDIRLYIKNKFQGNANFVDLEACEPEYAGALLREIAGKAQGVFLWVYLVVQSLLTGLRNGDRIQDLQRRLDMLPPDLENLFSKMLLSLDPFYREHASQIFQIYRAANEDISLLHLSFADEEDTEHVFRAGVRMLSRSEKECRFDKMKRRLNSRCMGLLEVASGQENVLANRVHWKVQYLHRTVKDFFGKPGIWKDLRRVTKASFTPYSGLCRASILHLKTLCNVDLTLNNFWSCIANCLNYALLAKETAAVQIRLLDEVDRTACELAARPESEVYQLMRSQTSTNLVDHHWTSIRFSFVSSCPFLHLMVLYDQHKYVQTKLSRMSPGARDAELASLLNTALSDFGGSTLPRDKPVNSQRAPRLRTIRVLFEEGADPNGVGPAGSPSPWVHACSIGMLEAPSEASRRAWQEVAESFISHGADPGTDVHGIVSPTPSERDARSVQSSRMHREVQEAKLQYKPISRRRAVGMDNGVSDGDEIIAIKQYKREDDELSITSIRANASDSRLSLDSSSASESSDSSDREHHHFRVALADILPSFSAQKPASQHQRVPLNGMTSQQTTPNQRAPANLEAAAHPRQPLDQKIVLSITNTPDSGAAPHPRASSNAKPTSSREIPRVQINEITPMDSVKHKQSY